MTGDSYKQISRQSQIHLIYIADRALKMETIVGSGRGHFSDLEHRGVGCLYFILGKIIFR